eukprot:TRINITY_DN11988_c0_g1_i1.p2 TRINITY_DN11988_c0_g1~~TRINITY_DN11988_c0_g1_i1.p2  ORF type:complete len:184 (-),score=35.48 TRINITY_DN11988_c0_g1_i1:763-1314(-)
MSRFPRYNALRRMVDHRNYYDFNYSANYPILSRPWLTAIKQRAFSNLIYFFGGYYSAYSISFGISLIMLDAWIRGDRADPNLRGQLNNPTKPYNEKFLYARGDRTVDKGRWNHNFQCWEKEPNCGRDFDEVYVKKVEQPIQANTLYLIDALDMIDCCIFSKMIAISTAFSLEYAIYRPSADHH